jgi:hypothetical protein
MTDAASEYATAELVRELETLREQQKAIRAVLRALAGSARPASGAGRSRRGMHAALQR